MENDSGNVVSSRRQELCCQPLPWAVLASEPRLQGTCLSAHLLLLTQGPKLKPNKGLKPTKGLACLLLTPVQLWSLLWLYGRSVLKPGQELPAPYRYLGLHPVGGLSGEMSLPSCPILACISVQPQSQALHGLLWVPEVSSE